MKKAVLTIILTFVGAGLWGFVASLMDAPDILIVFGAIIIGVGVASRILRKD